VRSPEEFAAAFGSFRTKGAEAILMRSSPLIFGFRKELCSLSMTHKLLSITQNREQAEAGCTVSYGVKLSEMHGLAAGHAERFPELAQQLVRDKASVIVASGDAAVRAAQQATRTIPIIAVVDDIVAAGLIDSLARPGGNTTGVSILATELDAKRLDILKRRRRAPLRGSE